jgi:hypothetical protein
MAIRALLLLITLILAGCGGGGGGGSSAAALAISFPLQSGMANSVAVGASTYYSVSGGCSGTASTIDSVPIAAVFEGVAAKSVLTTTTMNFTNCVPLAVSSTTLNYYNAGYLPLGSSITGSHYGMLLTLPTIPALVKVGDTGIFGTQTLYTDSSKTVLAGSDVYSYVVEPDAANSAIVNIITKNYDAAGVLATTVQSRYRILTNGTMTPVSVDLQYSGASTLHLVLTVTSAPVVAGSWSAPVAVSNDLYPQFAGAQISGDQSGNMLLAAPLIPTPTQSVIAEYQKVAGQSWSAQYALSPVKVITSSVTASMIQPQLKSDSSGNAVAAWVDMDKTALSNRNFISHVYVRNYNKLTGWGLPVLMQSNIAEYATSVNLTVQPDGTAWVAWTERTVTDPVFSTNDQFAIFAAQYTPLTGWGVAEKVTANFLDAAAGVNFAEGKMLGRIVTDNAANPTVLWTADSLSLNSTRKTAGVWGASTVVAASVITPGTVNYISDFDIANDTAGNAIAVWQRLEATGLIKTVYSNRYTPIAGWGGIVAMPSVLSQHSISPKIAMDSLGNAILLWSEFDGTKAAAIWGVRFDHLTGWKVPAMISSAPLALFEDSTLPQIAFDILGNAVAIWMKYDASLNKTVIRANRYNVVTGWGINTTISNGVGVVKNPSLAVSGGGKATAVWGQDDVGNLSFKLWTNDFIP